MKTKTSLLAIILLVFIGFAIYESSFTIGYDFDVNYRNVSVDTRVNVTDAPPTVLSVIVEENNGTANNITLAAGRTRTVYCNATIRDWNGFDDINRTNATFWDNNNVLQTAALDNNTLYRNTSCTNAGNDGLYTSYWVCAMDVLYYANNGSDWRCNVTAVDNTDFSASNYNITDIEPLYALNITTKEIDYGNVAVEAISDNKTANITNFGNLPINVTVWGYARFPGDNLAMNCTISGNISIDNERWSLNASQAWADKASLTATPNDLNLTVAKQTNPAVPIINTTYWQLYVPSDPIATPAGECTGTVVFTAEAS